MVENPKIGEKYYFLHYCGEYRIEPCEIWQTAMAVKTENGEIYTCCAADLYISKDEAKNVLIYQYESVIQMNQEKLKKIKSL